MAKKKTTESDKIKTKQMKIFLNLNEHAIVTMAANLKGMHVRDYMKRAAVEQAKKDVKEVNKIGGHLNPATTNGSERASRAKSVGEN